MLRGTLLKRQLPATLPPCHLLSLTMHSDYCAHHTCKARQGNPFFRRKVANLCSRENPLPIHWNIFVQMFCSRIESQILKGPHTTHSQGVADNTILKKCLPVHRKTLPWMPCLHGPSVFSCPIAIQGISDHRTSQRWGFQVILLFVPTPVYLPLKDRLQRSHKLFLLSNLQALRPGSEGSRNDTMNCVGTLYGCM